MVAKSHIKALELASDKHIRTIGASILYGFEPVRMLDDRRLWLRNIRIYAKYAKKPWMRNKEIYAKSGFCCLRSVKML